jgi:rod shape-determining protein MreD
LGRYLSIPILFVVVVAQSTLLPPLRALLGAPDLLLLTILAWALLAGFKESIWWAVVGGVLQDISIGLPTGTTALPLVVLVFVIDLVIGPVGHDNLIAPILTAAVGTLGYHLALALILTLIGRPFAILSALQSVTLPTLAFNVLFSIPVYRLVGLLFRATRPRRVSL